MKITCITAANVEAAGNNSASVRMGRLVREHVLALDPHSTVDVLPLLDYALQPCCMCGRCQQDQRCARDEAFNRVFEALLASDGLVFIVPHYAPLPSKLMMLLEKMQEIAFLNWVANAEYRFPLAGKPAGVIGHGGQPTTPEVIAYYQRALVDPVAMSLASLAMNITPAGEDAPRGVAVGIRSIARRPGTVFVDIEHDWDDIRARLAPLARNLLSAGSPARQN